MSLSSAIPIICVSPAPVPEAVVEPYSPFSPKSFTFGHESDGYRATHLTPPATSISFKRNLSLSPLRPPDSPITGKGLERQRFEALLQASRERNASVGAKRSLDLRKNVAMKAHNRKTMERRAIFLSKVLAPPSPTATDLPKTPPDSPAIFHYTLPSPGLVSPLAHFETCTSENPANPLTREPWVEQVDFRLPIEEWVKIKARDVPNAKITVVDPPRRTHRRKMPSLDEITARLVDEKESEAAPAPAPIALPKTDRLPSFLSRKSSPTAVEKPVEAAAVIPTPRLDRLPAFLQRNSTPAIARIVEKPVEAEVVAKAPRLDRLPAFLQPKTAQKPAEKVVLAPIVIPTAPAPAEQAPTVIRVGRLTMPARRISPTTPSIAVTPASPEQKGMPYTPPRSPLSPKLQITTTIVSRSVSASPIQLSADNLVFFNQKRDTTSKNMMLKIAKRRGISISVPKLGIENIEPGSPVSPVSPGGTKKSRRFSSPADLPARKRNGFESSVLNLPGAF